MAPRCHPLEIEAMRRRGLVDRGWFAHFFISLRSAGYEPAPRLFGLGASAP
jgi:hypothetical protein